MTDDAVEVVSFVVVLVSEVFFVELTPPADDPITLTEIVDLDGAVAFVELEDFAVDTEANWPVGTFAVAGVGIVP